MKKTAALIMVVILLSSCTFSVSTANISEPGMTTGMAEGKPVDRVTEYQKSAEAFYAYGILNNAPDNTTVRFVWK